MTASTRPVTTGVNEPTVYVAFELGKKEWKLGLTAGFGGELMIRTLRSGDLRAVARVIGEARRRFEVPDAARIVSCYEAGRDGFWIHRALATLGVHNRVVDSASIEVNRRARRTKTDRIDARKLGVMLVRVCTGGGGVLSGARVAKVGVQAARARRRELTPVLP